MNISYTYVYELVNEETNNVFYIGKTNNPQNRFGGHRNYNRFGDGVKFFMRIVKKYYDAEDEIICKYINEGHRLLNKRKNDYIIQEYEVGQIIKYDPYLIIDKMFKK